MAKKPEQESFADMFKQFGRDLNLPKVEVDRIIEHHRRNFEAMEQSARAASTGASTMAARQREMVQEVLDEFANAASNQNPPGTPQEFMARQADFARKSFEMAIRNTTEMADMMRRSGDESAEILRKRIQEGMEEIRSAYEKRS